MSLKASHCSWVSKVDKTIAKADEVLERAEDVARVPEGLFITSVVLSKTGVGSSLMTVKDGLGAFRGGVSILRVVPAAWNLGRGKTCEGDSFRIIFNVILVVCRALVLVSFLHIHNVAPLSPVDIEGVGFGIIAGFTLVGILAFIRALSVWQEAKSEKSQAERLQEFQKNFETEGYARSKAKELAKEKLAKEIDSKGDDAFSEGLEVLVSPLDTGAVSHQANPFVVVPLALIGTLSASVRLWRAYSD